MVLSTTDYHDSRHAGCPVDYFADAPKMPARDMLRETRLCMQARVDMSADDICRGAMQTIRVMSALCR